MLIEKGSQYVSIDLQNAWDASVPGCSLKKNMRTYERNMWKKKGEKPLTFVKSRPLKVQYQNELCSLELNQLKRHKKRRAQDKCPFGRDYSLGKIQASWGCYHNCNGVTWLVLNGTCLDVNICIQWDALFHFKIMLWTKRKRCIKGPTV